MIPTLFGRWQTRLFLTFAVGVPVTFFFALWLYTGQIQSAMPPFVILGYLLIFGFFWDVLWVMIQKCRWDRDFPFAFQFLTGVVEGLFMFQLVRIGRLFFLPDLIPASFFWSHYSTTFLLSFIVIFGPLKILFPCWRYEGGQFGRS